MNEKAAQGEWPLRAPVGYVNNKETHRIEIDAKKAAFVRKLFEWYATGSYSLQQLADKAKRSGLFSRNSQYINKAGIHRILTNPIYYGEFVFKGKRYVGTHEPIITRKLFDQVQHVLHRGKPSGETKRKLPFARLITCHRCGCAFTPEVQKEKYVYYHCTAYRGKCGNVYVREERLADLLAKVVRQVQVSPDTVEDIKKALRDSQEDKVRFHEESIKTLQQRYNRTQRMLDKAYEDKLAGSVSDELWKRKSAEWESELSDIRGQLQAHENANFQYYESGVQILELANQAYGLYLAHNRQEQRRLLDTLLLNCTFDRGTLYPTYRKPFDILAKGSDRLTKRG
jgi:hypothetical protein